MLLWMSRQHYSWRRLLCGKGVGSMDQHNWQALVLVEVG